MSSCYRCHYLILDPLRLIDVTNHTDQTQTKGLYITRKVYGYSVYTSTVFKGVYTKQGKVDYGAQQSQLKTVTRQNTNSKIQRRLVFHLVASFKALVPVLSMSQTKKIELKPKDCIFLVKFQGIQFTPQLFLMVSIPNKVSYNSAPNSHKFKPSPDEI